MSHSPKWFNHLRCLKFWLLKKFNSIALILKLPTQVETWNVRLKMGCCIFFAHLVPSFHPCKWTKNKSWHRVIPRKASAWHTLVNRLSGSVESLQMALVLYLQLCPKTELQTQESTFLDILDFAGVRVMSFTFSLKWFPFQGEAQSHWIHQLGNQRNNRNYPSKIWSHFKIAKILETIMK